MRKTHDYIHRYRGYWSDGAGAKSGLTGTILVGEAASYPGVNEGTTERGTASRMEAQAAFGVELSTEYAGDADL